MQREQTTVDPDVPVTCTLTELRHAYRRLRDAMRSLGVRQQQQRQLHHAAPLDVSSWILPDLELRPLQPVRKAWSEMEKYANGESVTLLSSGRVNGFDLDALAMEERNETVDVLVSLLMQLAREHGHSDVAAVSQVDRPFVAIEKHEDVERVITADVERPGGVISVPWLPSECQSLEQLVLDDRLNGNDVTDWAMILSHFPNRSAADCQRMFEWRRTIPSPTANFDVWLAATPATPVGGIAQPTGPSHLLGGTLPLAPRRTRSRGSKPLCRYRIQAQFTGGSGPVRDLCMLASKRGTYLAIASLTNSSVEYNRMGNLQLYSLETLLPGTVRAHALPVNDPSRIPDAHQVTIFHTPHPRLHDHLVQDSGEEMFYKTLTDVKFAAANERLLTSSMDGSVAVWSLEGRLQKIFHGSAMDADSRGRGVVYERMHRGEDQSVEAGIASRVAASAAPNDTLRNGRARPTPTKPVPSVNRLVLHPEQSHVVASCMSDGTTWLWDVRDHCDSPALMSARGEGRRLWGTDDRVIVPDDDKTHGAPVGEHFRHYYGGGLIGQERMLSCSDAVFGRGPSRDRLFAAYEQNEQTHSNSSIRVYDGLGLRPCASSVGGTEDVTCLAMSGSGTYLAAGVNGDEHAQLYDAATMVQIAQLPVGHSDMNVVAISPCETFVAVGSDGAQDVAVFDLRFARSAYRRLFHGEPNNSNRNLISAAVWTPKGMLLSGGADGCVRTWDMSIGGNPLVQCLPVTCDVSGAGPTGAIGMVDRSQGVADGGSIWSISILERIVDERGYATALDETMVCCGTATGKTFVMALTADE